MQGESRTMERQKERERGSMRDSVLLKMKDSIGNKIDCLRKIFMADVGD